MTGRFLFTAMLLFCFAISSLGRVQQAEKKAGQEPVLQLKTELIEVRAVVTDKQNRPVEGLKKEDFEILEDGRPQEISFFSEQRIGRQTTQAASPTVNPPAALQGGLKPAETARWVILIVDTLHLSAVNMLRVKQTLKQFIAEQLTDQDAVMLLTSAGTDVLAAHFTKDRQLLRYAIDRIASWRPGQTTYFTATLAADIKRGNQSAIALGGKILESEEYLTGMPPDMLQRMAVAKASVVLSEASYQRKNLLGLLKAASETMAGLSGQRLMVLLSDGFSLMNAQGYPDTQDLRAIVSRAVRYGVVIYALDTDGLQPPAEFDASRRGLSADSSTLGRLSSYLRASEKDDQNGMNALAKDTGGDVFFNTNDLPGALQKTMEDNHVYYALAYYPAVEGTDATRFRPLTVRVKNHPEYQIRTQKGYTAADLKTEKKKADSPQEKFYQAITAPIPSTSIHISAAANHLEVANDKAQASLQVRIDGSNLTYREQGKHALIDLELVAFIYDRGGNPVRTYMEKIQGKMEATNLTQTKRVGFQYAKRLELKPGVYVIRVGVREPATEHIGTAVSWLEVPDISKGKFAVSSILLADSSAARQSSTVLKTELTQWRAMKAYKSGSLLIYYLVLYNLSDKEEEEMLVRSETIQEEQAIYQSDWQPLRSRLIGKEKRGLEIGGQMNLSLKPGIYELRISIRNAKSDQATRRTVLFAVED